MIMKLIVVMDRNLKILQHPCGNLWQSLREGKRVEPHYHKTCIFSHARVGKYLCEMFPLDEGKTTWVKTCDGVLVKYRNKYKKEEEVTCNKSKNSRVEYEISGSHRRFGVDPYPSMLVDTCLGTWGVEQSQISLIKVVRMTLVQFFLDFSMHVAYHWMFFSHFIGMKWYNPSMVSLMDTRALGMTNIKPRDLTRKEPKYMVLWEI